MLQSVAEQPYCLFNVNGKEDLTMLRKIHLVTLKRFTRLLVLLMVIQMFISGEPAPGAKAVAKAPTNEDLNKAEVKF